MKKKYIPYNLEDIKKYLIDKNYQDYSDGTYSHYRKMFEFLYPNLTPYYIRNLIMDLIECDFFTVRFYRGRRYFRIKTEAINRDEGYITF